MYQDLTVDYLYGTGHAAPFDALPESEPNG